MAGRHAEKKQAHAASASHDSPVRVSHDRVVHAQGHVRGDFEQTQAHLAQEEDPAQRSLSTRSTIALFIGIVLIIACFSAMVYFGIQLSKPKPLNQDYNGYHFTQDQGIYWTQVQKGQTPYNLPFMTAPWDVESIYIPRSTLEPIWNHQLNKSYHVYMSVDINSTGTAVVAATNIARVIGNKYGIYNMNVSSALNAPSSSGAQVIDCRNSSARTFVLLVTLSNRTRVSAQGPASTCFLIEAKNATELLRVSDAYTYHLLGIMKS